MDFVKSIRTSQSVPEEAPRFDPFAPEAPPAAPLTQRAAPTAPIPGAAVIDLEYHCRRFFMGRELQSIEDGGAKIFDDRDESGELMAVMDKQLRGEAVLFVRKESILGDGSVVVWLEWGERKSKPWAAPAGDDTLLGEHELTSPERITPRSKAADAEEPPPRPLGEMLQIEVPDFDPDEGEYEPDHSPNDEEDW